MNGGSKLGEGGFGCIYDQSLECKDSRKQVIKPFNKSYITKITLNEDADKQMKISKELVKLEQENGYQPGQLFGVYLSSCRLNKKSWDKEKIYETCDVLERVTRFNRKNIRKSYPGMVSKKATEGDLGNFIDDGKWDNLSGFDRLTFIIDYFIAYKILHSKYIHFDMKDLNVLVTKVGGKYMPIIADFDFAFEKSKFNSKKLFNDHKRRFGKPPFINPKTYIWGPKIASDLYYFNKMSQKDQKHFLETLDIYSIGKYTFEDEYFDNTKNSKKIQNFIKNRMTNEDFRKRPTVDECLKFFDAMRNDEIGSSMSTTISERKSASKTVIKKKKPITAIKKKKCPEDKKLNPKTNRCIKKRGKLEKKLAKEGVIKISESRTKTQKYCPSGKIVNPKTNRCIKKDGLLAKKMKKEGKI